MKVLLLGTALVALSLAPATAADMPVKAPPPVAAPVMTWTGCYVGVNAGYGWGQDHVSSGGVNEGEPKFRGGLVGGQVGCDYQFAPQWVIGVEGMFDWANLTGSVVDPANLAATTSSKYSGLATVGARLGLVVFDRSLIYVKTGAGWSRSQRSIIGPGFTQFTPWITKASWMIGGGWEYMITANWSAKVEYNHFRFGNFNESVTQQPGGAIFQQNDNNSHVDVVLVGLNYRFK
jgi:outer membrane immunogenic protein